MKSLEFENKNCWEHYHSEKDKKAMRKLAEEYINFLSKCKTERETIDYAMTRLEKAGFSTSGQGHKLMRDLHGKALFAVKKGKAPLSEGFRMICAHSDSPRLDFKQRPLQEQCNVGQAQTHYYGGIRKYQWFARPLAIHGIVVKENGEKIKVVIGEKDDEPVFAISDLLPHLAREDNQKTVAKAFVAEKMNLILTHKPYMKDGEKIDSEDKSPVKSHILKILNDKYGIIEEDLYSAELQAVPAGRARFVGLDSSLIGGYGQDDRICVFTGLEALLHEAHETPEHTQILMLWDKEEIGSEGSTGAKSRFMEYCLQDLLEAWEPETRFSDLMLAGKAISADVSAAMDPDWQELHEKLNAALIGQGPCFNKYTGSGGKYETNDAHPEYIGWMRGVLNSKDIPWQMAQLGKVDGGGGGTVAMYLAAYGTDVIDCGPAVLSMHSPFEISSKADIYATTLAFIAFMQA